MPMEPENKTSEKALIHSIELLTRLTKLSAASPLRQKLEPLKRLIEKDLSNGLSKRAPYFFPKLYFEFEYEYQRFFEFLMYKELMGKKIIALGGGFSSGKSSFLNSLLGKNLLPAQIDPSTSIPTYVTGGSEEKAYALNIFQNKIPISLQEVRSIAHGFGETEDESGNLVSKEISLAHILKTIFITTPREAYRHLAFLDTPGYSKPIGYEAKTDRDTAFAELNTSDLLLWFVPVDTGTITEEDLKFLAQLNKDIPKLIIISKADKCLPEEVNKVAAEVKKVLELRGIVYEDVCTYSRVQPFERDKILSYFSKLNKRYGEAYFTEHFSELFKACTQYYERKVEEESRKLNRINRALTFAEHKETMTCMASLREEVMGELSLLKECLRETSSIEKLFFYELNKIAADYEVALKEPVYDFGSYNDPLKLFTAYKEEQGIKEEPYLQTVLVNSLKKDRKLQAVSEKEQMIAVMGQLKNIHRLIRLTPDAGEKRRLLRTMGALKIVNEEDMEKWEEKVQLPVLRETITKHLGGKG